MKWFIKAINLWFSYDGKVDVIRGVNIDAVPSKVTVIMGPTGCGKTTLLFLLAGLLKPYKGAIYYNKKPLSKLMPAVKKYIGMLFQDPDDQLFNITVYDEIAFSLRTLGVDENIIRRKVHSISKFLGISELLDRQPYSLSVGEKRKVALASILVYNPYIMILDEPTANLDYKSIQLIEQIIHIAKNNGKTLIIATHDTDFALRIADRIYLMNNGMIKEWIKPEQLLSRKLLEEYGLKPPSVLMLAERLGMGLKETLKTIREER